MWDCGEVCLSRLWCGGVTQGWGERKTTYLGIYNFVVVARVERKWRCQKSKKGEIDVCITGIVCSCSVDRVVVAPHPCTHGSTWVSAALEQEHSREQRPHQTSLLGINTYWQCVFWLPHSCLVVHLPGFLILEHLFIWLMILPLWPLFVLLSLMSLFLLLMVLPSLSLFKALLILQRFMFLLFLIFLDLPWWPLGVWLALSSLRW
jgi:hypothetical protein